MKLVQRCNCFIFSALVVFTVGVPRKLPYRPRIPSHHSPPMKVSRMPLVSHNLCPLFHRGTCNSTPAPPMVMLKVKVMTMKTNMTPMWSSTSTSVSHQVTLKLNLKLKLKPYPKLHLNQSVWMVVDVD